MTFHGSVLRGNQVVVANVDGDYDVTTNSPGSVLGWSGSFVLPVGARIPSTVEQYTLALDDGRSGSFIISRVYTMYPIVVEFRGTGPPP